MSSEDNQNNFYERRLRFAWAKYYEACANQMSQSLDFIRPIRRQLVRDHEEKKG